MLCAVSVTFFSRGKWNFFYMLFELCFKHQAKRSLPSSEIPMLEQINYWGTASSLGHKFLVFYVKCYSLPEEILWGEMGKRAKGWK